VPQSCTRVEIHVAYGPKHLGEAESRALARSALRVQAQELDTRVGDRLADAWAAELTNRVEHVRVGNLVTISLDDASGAYRGAGHRQSPDQSVFIERDRASPGLMAGPLAEGAWTLTLSVHTLVTPRCALQVQIGAEVPTSTP
jgi:hypothetical protein